MKTRKNPLLLLVTLACTIPTVALSSLAKAQAVSDTIIKKNGKQERKVEIVSLDLDKITFTKGGKKEPQEIETSRVTGFRLSALPEEYVRAQSAANRGDFAGAGKLFAEATTKGNREIVKQVATFFAGRSFALAARKDSTNANNALAQLESYLSAAANGYYMPEAKVRLAQSRLFGGDAAGAETALASLENDAVSGSWPLRWSAEIKFAKAQAQVDQGKFADARSTLMGVAGAVDAALGEDNRLAGELDTLKTESLVMQGETYIGEKLYDDALNYYRTLSSSNARGVRAAAETGQGQILFLQGSDKADEQKLRQAQLALARASVEPDTSDSTTAKALYYMGKVLAALGDDEEQNASARAKTYFQSVKNNYGSTPWAPKARKELEG